MPPYPPRNAQRLRRARDMSSTCAWRPLLVLHNFPVFSLLLSIMPVNCIRADLFMNNALYKCCIITHCAVSHKDQIKKWYHRFIFHFFDLVEGEGVQVGGVLRGGRWVGRRWCVREVGGGGRHQIEQNWRFQ